MADSLKKQLHKQCLNFIEQKIEFVQQALREVSEAGKGETKSSAGDKHETARAMAQLEQEKLGKQLHESEQLMHVLSQINPNSPTSAVELGAAVQTSNGNFYIAIAVGKVEVNDSIYFAVSPAAPIAKAMLGLKSGEEFSFNGKTFEIEVVL